MVLTERHCPSDDRSRRLGRNVVLRCMMSGPIRKARDCWVRKHLRRWFAWAKAGGLAKQEVFDEEDEVFGMVDLTLKEKGVIQTSLRQFLMDCQKIWKHDGGVLPKERVREPEIEAVWGYVLKGRGRWPTEVITLDMDARDYVGRFWELSDYKGIRGELWDILVKTDKEELDSIRVFEETGTFKGDNTWADRCRSLGIPESKIREWVEGVDFDLNRDALPHYALGPYANIYDSMGILVMLVKECLRYLQIGKVLPMR